MQQDQTCDVNLGTVNMFHVCHVCRAPINNRQVRQFHQMAHSSADMMKNGHYTAHRAVVRSVSSYQLCMVLHGIAWYCIVLRGIAWYCFVFHGIPSIVNPGTRIY